MATLLPPQNAPKITYLRTPWSAQTMAENDLVLVVANAKSGKNLLRQCQRSPELLKQVDQLGGDLTSSTIHLSATGDAAGVLLIFVNDDASAFAQLQAMAKLWKSAASTQARKLALCT